LGKKKEWKMAQPTDTIMAFHNAFRRDITTIDTAALGMAQGKSGLESDFERFGFFSEMLMWHANGEEQGIYPALELVAPQVAEAYVMDHRGLDNGIDALNEAVSAHDPLRVARASAALKFHHDIHLKKEDAHLYRLFRERVAMPDQISAITIMSRSVPQDRFPEAIAWMFPLIGNVDRDNVVTIWKQVLPPATFTQLMQLVKKAVGNDWEEMVRRNPILA
jgi:hypothetical protein